MIAGAGVGGAGGGGGGWWGRRAARAALLGRRDRASGRRRVAVPPLRNLLHLDDDAVGRAGCIGPGEREAVVLAEVAAADLREGLASVGRGPHPHVAVRPRDRRRVRAVPGGRRVGDHPIAVDVGADLGMTRHSRRGKPTRSADQHDECRKPAFHCPRSPVPVQMLGHLRLPQSPDNTCITLRLQNQIRLYYNRGVGCPPLSPRAP